MKLALLIVGGLELSTGALTAQDTAAVNIYRFVLGIDVPESPALVAMGLAPTHVLSASAPKPIVLSVLGTFPSGGSALPGVAIDVGPYFLSGGGPRSLASYRSMSVAGRLTRVLTKTIFSLSAAPDPSDPGASLVGLGIRSTFHDPHDVVSLSLPEEVAAELAKAGVPTPGASEEDVGDRGVNLEPLFGRARRQIRNPTANPQVSGGWGVATHLRGGVLRGDSIETVRHCLWLGATFTSGRRFDVLSIVEIRNAFRSDRFLWLGAGFERKTTVMGLLAELYYDTEAHRFYPGIAVDTRVSSHVGIVGSLTTQSARLKAVGPRRLELHTLVHWFYASDQ